MGSADLAPRLDIPGLRQQLEDGAHSLGITSWDLGAACSSDTSVQVDRGEPKQMKASQRNGVSVRVWNDAGLVGITSTSDLTPEGVAAALEGARAASAFGDSEDPPRFSPLAMAPLPPLASPEPAVVSIQALLARLIDTEARLLARHGAIHHVPYNGLGQRSSERLYLNSEGAMRCQRFRTASLYLYARAEEEGRKPRSAGAVRLAHGVDGLDVEGCIDEAAERTISHLDYAPIDTGVYNVCFSPEAFLDLIGAFSNMFSARAVLDGVSLSSRGSLGSQVASPLLNLVDDGRHPDHIGAASFDGEGTPTHRLALIEQGRLTHFLHSEGTARRFADGSQATGHASMGAKVSVSPSWFDISGGRGDQSLSLATADNVVLIDTLSALHAGVKATQGSFSLPFDGWLIRAGERRSIEAATVAGDIRKVLDALLALEGDPVVTPDGRCPHVWVAGLSITGEQG
ncbi:MAG: TldD/PmbA family protein [Aphanocapsa feldmannii 277cV]|uniref:TldD/PmbA family protein n=2 Tax=Aphanocapsa feldmannii TaxID=192050 RepID=A0A524RKS1_9CHRO|nr:MAG: TldD/PmbA family protein [Aphanocapsa feldmannii 288cV]TGG90467.1 MAG: TldD/PmbA family protein [Aphanocapsa feldmannii 277cV]TGH27864.1 MAG: TldD/PmbA family protein [Aphanocapsa feldmannii 277cI]